MDNDRRPPLQFSPAELLGTIAMTFAGMLIFKSVLTQLSEIAVFFVVAITTWVAALSTMDGNLAIRRKFWKLVDRILLAWICLYFTFWLLAQSGEVLLAVLAFVLSCIFITLIAHLIPAIRNR
jgi:hypothetical protein